MPQAQLVMEESSPFIPHDQLFKELIRTFFDEFVEAFFPKMHQMIDFENTTFLSEEVFTDLLDGKNRRLDIVVETKLKNTDAVVIVHVEPQSTPQSDFHERMYNYFSIKEGRLKPAFAANVGTPLAGAETDYSHCCLQLSGKLGKESI